MHLTSISLADIGVYKGENTFDLRAKPDRPIVLYGGVNGAGKTTLFESIPLCLYGQNFGEQKIGKKQYHQKIHKMFHRNKDMHTSSHDACITLEFEYVQNGSITLYKITRRWQNNEGKIDEFLTMSKKPKAGAKFTRVDADESQIQGIINQIIPKGIASMFIFDGEKIQEIAQAGNENVHIKSSFDNLLGLDVPSQLHDDIGLYVLRNSDGDADAVLAELDNNTKVKTKAEENLGSIKEKCIFLRSEISNHHKILESKEEKFFKMGGHFAQKRQKLVNEKNEMENTIAFIERNLHNIIVSDLPLAIASEQLEQVRDELEADKARMQEIFAKDILDDTFADLTKKVKPLLKSYDKKIHDEVMKEFRQVMDAKLESLSGGQKMTFGFSLSDMDRMTAKIDSMVDSTRHMINEYQASHIDCIKKLDVINAKLSTAPKQDESGPLYSEIKAITLEIGEMEQELQTLERLEAQEKSMIVLLNAKIRKCLQRKKLDKRNSRGLDMAPRIQDALDDYSQRLRAQKIKLLESNILKGIQKCFHKDRLITGISIDLDTYDVTLSDGNGDKVTKDQLSKGELQMYATAIVWGLAKTSNRPLPFVIDTPLARLDEKHRENMIKSFYPTASHQSIIFSTDTEIARSCYDELEPHIAQAHLIRYDADRDVSVLDDGYFEEKQIAL